MVIGHVALILAIGRGEFGLDLLVVSIWRVEV